MERTFLIDARFKESNFFSNLTVKMYRHMFVLEMTLCNLFFSFLFNEVLKLETNI